MQPTMLGTVDMIDKQQEKLRFVAESNNSNTAMRALRYCFSFSGRFNRSNFWAGYGIAFVMTMAVVAAIETTAPDNMVVAGIGGLWCILWLVSIMAVATKRLHDLNQSGLLLVAFFVVLAVLLRSQGSQVEGLICGIGLIALGALPGVKGKNRFDPDPSR